MNGSPEFPLFLEKGTFNRANVENLYLITDGLYSGAESWESLLDNMEAKGLKGYTDELYTREQDDAMLLAVPRLKVSDDKTGMVLRFV